MKPQRIEPGPGTRNLSGDYPRPPKLEPVSKTHQKLFFNGQNNCKYYAGYTGARDKSPAPLIICRKKDV